MTDWLLANPHAGDGERNGDFWRDHLSSVGLESPRPCDLDDLGWVEQVQAGDRILAAGGDGSVNRAAELCLQTGAHLAVLPSGTANDFFRNLGIENTPEAICQALVDCEAVPVDVGEYDDGLCLNVAHVGLGTMPARDTSGSGDSKKWLGQFSYVTSLMGRLFSRRGFRATITTERATISGRWLTIAIANGTYFGGGSEVPGATVTNGKLVVLAVRPASITSLMGAFILTRFLGHAPKDNKTVVALDCSWCQVTSRRKKTITVDGDVAGHTPLKVSCLPAALNVVGTPQQVQAQ